ncbi:unnamed protein product [Nesidiocoris tenuis]|uniref:BTB domain-containing protein n=1 Tax=Nesidiocoris tenuis TaxID=355587 RepID=A0A6H5H3S2_9HEMI|nr:unnamed protein product [Nesidiocoris tenuis]
MDNTEHHQELVKCVVVGDTAVGKTRLICARACNKQLSLSQLLTTHVPTVWAIDQYRIYKDVLERSWEVVDGVNVSLRLWDTFGDHEKDRRFAYGRSDVVLLCFSLASPNSLRNCKAMWYPEIRKFCPNTPVILVGCKNDLRFMYRDEAYLDFFRERSPFLRAIRKSDLVMPDQARSIARELGVTYYETSVLTYYGVNEVFENAIRAALIARRQQRFWMTNLKKVQRPLLQVSSFGEATSGDFNEDTEFLIRVEKPSRGGVWEQLKRRSSCQVLTSTCNTPNLRVCANRELNHPAFTSIRVQQVEDMDTQGRLTASLQTIITLSKLVTPQAMQQTLMFLYTGTIDSKFTQIQEIRQAAEFMELPELQMFVSNMQSHEEFLNPELKQRYRQAVRVRLNDLCLSQGLFADVIFQLDDGCIPAHKPLLMARCDMMRAMFSGDFREGSAKVIHFPGVRCEVFRVLLCYLYCDAVGPLSPHRCVDLLELANRLCLPRLINLIEKRVVEELVRICTTNDNSDVVEICLKLLEPCKLHNADQLADWCMSHLCTNYNKLCKMSPKLLRSLHPDNQEYLMENRWPPVWYLKDFDYYDKCASEREREERVMFKRGSSGGGCLCFGSSAARGATSNFRLNPLNSYLRLSRWACPPNSGRSEHTFNSLDTSNE